MFKTILEYALGVAAFGFVCSVIGVDTSIALMTVSQAAGKPWLPMIELNYVTR